MDKPSIMKKKFFLVLLLPILIAGIGLVILTSNKNLDFDTRSRASTVTTSLAFNVPTQNINLGDIFSVGLSLNTGDETVTATELHLSYDPQLQVESFTKTDYMPITLQDAGFGNGKASIVLGVDPSAPRKGSGILATITFKALSAGTPTVRIDQTTQVAALGKDTNVLSELPQAAQITIQRTATATPIQTFCPDTKPNGDSNCDGRITGLDYVIWLNTQCNPEGSQTCRDLRTDFNGDLKVNNEDYELWFTNSR